MIRHAALLLLFLTVATDATPADPAQRAAEAAEDLRSATTSLAEAERADDRIAALTATIQAHESGLGAMRSALRDAAIRERALRERLASEEDRLSRLLGGLQTLGRSPEASVLLHPSGAESTVRAAMLMETVAPALSAEVTALKADLEELAILSALRKDAYDTLQSGLDSVQAARSVLGQAMSERQPLPEPLATDAAALQALLNSAETLDAFAAYLVDGGPGPDTPTFEAARGRLPLPVDATQLTGFGEADPTGTRRQGLLLATEPATLITAPWPATVRYAGPLLNYGDVIILEPEDGYLLILAGVGTVFTAFGAVVDTGDPLGLTAGQSPGADQILNETGVGGGQLRTETLYMELRTGEGPVDPADWFALGRE